MAAIRRQLLAAPAQLGLLHRLAAELPDTAPLVQWAAPRLGRDGRVPDEASGELTRLRRQITRLRQQLTAELEVIRRAHPDAATDAPPTLRRDRYCLPVRSGARGQLPGLVLDSSGSGATVFLEPFAVVDLNNDLADSAAREGEEVRRILDEVTSAFAGARESLADALDCLAELDAAQARAQFGRRVEGRLVLPEDDADLVLVRARHPLLDERLQPLRRELLGESERRDPVHRVVPLDFRLDPEVRTLVISGPNAGGKTLVLKTLGLFVLLAANGIPLPADEGTRMPTFARIWCHIGDEQDVTADLSTFSAAMAATAELLREGDRATLALYDELGAGTDPLEGAALACAVLEELTRRRCLTVATTHLAAVAMAAASTPAMSNAAMGYDEDAGRPTYTLSLGRPGRSRGLDIARSMGVHPVILDRARALLGDSHLELDRWLRRLEQRERELLQQGFELEAERARVEAVRELEESAVRRLEEERRGLARTLSDERERLRRLVRGQLDEALARLDEATREQRPLGRRQRQRLRDEALAVEVPSAAGEGAATVPLGPGAKVRLRGVGEGTLQEVRGVNALVVAAGKRLWLPLGELEAGEEATTTTTPRRPAEAEATATQELNLLGLDRESAREELERFLDRALATGLARVRVVHGHGTGALRRMVRELCSVHPAVRSFRHPPQHFGGTGATEIALDGSDDERA